MTAQTFLLWSRAALGAACGRAAVRGFCAHPWLSGKQATALRRKMNVSGEFTASRVMGQKTS